MVGTRNLGAEGLVFFVELLHGDFGVSHEPLHLLLLFRV